MGLRRALHVGERTVLAMTCNHCRRLLPGDAFPMVRSHAHEKHHRARRCVKCWWARMEASPGR